MAEGAGDPGPHPGRVGQSRAFTSLRPEHTVPRTPQAPGPRGLAPFTSPESDTMTQAKDGDTVRITYTGTLTDGTVFDSSDGRDPLEFTIGSGQIIAGLDKAMPGMEVGERKRVEIGVMEAYGPRHADRVVEVPLDELPADIPREVGTMLAMQGEDGQQLPVRVAAVSETKITLDANHALAGQDLVFDIELVSIG